MNSPVPSSPHDPYEALRLPALRRFFAARFLLTIGIQVQAVVVGWQLYAITKDPLSLGLIGLTEAIPAIGLALYAGHIVDSYPKKLVMAGAYSIQFITGLVLLAYTFALRAELF